jgi:1-acyl-sn-glycerol-3-phosphate acyltransferase
MNTSPVRATVRLLVYALLTVPLMPVQGLALLLSPRLARRIPVLYHALCCRIFGFKVQTIGDIATKRPVLFIANHVSYFDIVVMSSVVETSFVARSDIAKWPFFSWLAKLQRTVFVDRKRATVAAERDTAYQRLVEGYSLVLFPEGTSTDGTRLKPFKSAFFNLAERPVNGKPVTVQPVSIVYARLDGMPIGRQLRPYFAWYGAMDLPDHMFHALGLGDVTVTLVFHKPVTIAEFESRKALARHCEAVVAHGIAASHAGAHLPARPKHHAAPAGA